MGKVVLRKDNNMKEFYEKNKKKLDIAFIVAIILFVVYLAWSLYFSKIVIFNKEVAKVEDAGKKYYAMYATNLPTSESQVTKVTLRTLYEKDFIKAENLYVPKTKTGCNLDESWVKVRKENGIDKYYTYLKCGKYENKVDHVGPTITLNGKKEVTIDVNATYKDEGVKSVKDNVDGNIETSKVTIEGTDIDTTKVGTYKVKYSVTDSLLNKTVETRTVKVVRKLEGIIKQDTNGLNYYSESVENNYLQFSGMLWKIVGLNKDGTIKIIASSPIANLIYGNETKYKNSNVYKWLNDYFYDHIESKDYIVEKTWCVKKTGDVNNISDKCDEQVKAKVGLLNVDEFNKNFSAIGIRDTSVFTLTKSTNKKKQAYIYDAFDFDYQTIENDDYAGIMPVINIKEGLYVSTGNGTASNPYIINDYKRGKANTPIKDRLVGEYINYSGYLWRISENNKNDAILIMQGDVGISGRVIMYLYEGKTKTYNIKEKGNVGYKVEKNIEKYLTKTKNIINNNWEIPTIDANKTFNTYKKERFKSKYSIPASYDIFSAGSDGRETSWLIDTDKNEKYIRITSPTGMAFRLDTDGEGKAFEENGIQLKIKIKNNLKIVSGGGTVYNPYTVK